MHECVAKLRAQIATEVQTFDIQGTIGSVGRVPHHNIGLFNYNGSTSGTRVVNLMMGSRGPPSKHGLSNSQSCNNRDEVCSVERPTSRNHISSCVVKECDGRTDITANIRAYVRVA